MDKAIVLIGAAAAVAMLVGLCWLIGFRASVKIVDEAQARALIAGEAPGAAVSRLLIDAKGQAALAALGDGRFAAIRAMGDRFAVRVMPAGKMSVRLRAGGAACITWADIGFPPLLLRLGAEGLPDWLAGRTAEPATGRREGNP
jgi:hypothetical protein